MANPFLRRATEFIRDDSAFLSIVSPEPLTTFVARHPRKDALFDLPVRVIGSPGSGKTMMATLVEFRLVEAILRDQSSDNNRALAAALAACNLIDGERPLVAAVRLPMEFEYRDFWELPYDAQLKTKLVLSLIQARGMLGLFRNLLTSRRRTIDTIRFAAHEGTDAQVEQIGGLAANDVRERARKVERAVYSIGAGLLPPSIDEIPAEARDPYQPFSAIREVEIDWEGHPIRLKPLIILDDVHTLHPNQFELLFRSLARREMKIGRWMMMRMDALSPSTVFRSAEEETMPGLKRDRDFIDIFMQSRGERGDERRQFRRMATDMADRYLAGVTSLRERNFVQFSRLLATEPPQLPAGKLAELRAAVDRDQKRLNVAQQRREKLQRLVAMYAQGAKSYDTGEDVQLAMLRVLLHRYANRVVQQTPVLFEASDPEPKTPLKADASVADAARIHLHKEFGRPYHYGLDALCDASSENAELFLQLAGALVSRMETKVIRNLDPALTPAQQQSELTAKAAEIIDNWSFPFARKVRNLVDQMATECLEMTHLPHARLGGGANAVGIPEPEMEVLLGGEAELALILKFAIAYGALTAIRNYGQGGKNWCLLELSGPVCLRYGLTLKRGGFLERRVEDLSAITEKT
jgi:hypothetical protein